MTDTVQSGPRLDESGLEQLLAGLTAVRGGDFSTRLAKTGDPLMDEIATVFNGMADQLDLFTSEVTRVAREVGTEGKLGGQAHVPGVSGTWKDLTESVNAMAGNLTGQVRNIAQVATAVARGDLSQKIDVDARGEILELKSTLNTMVDQLSSFADEVTRVAREVGTEGKLGGQADVKGVSGTWKDLTEPSTSWRSASPSSRAAAFYVAADARHRAHHVLDNVVPASERRSSFGSPSRVTVKISSMLSGSSRRSRTSLVQDVGRGSGSAFLPCRTRPAPMLVATHAGPKRAAIWVIAPQCLRALWT